MEVLAEVWLAWNQQIGATVATILALAALLKSDTEPKRQCYES